MKLRLRAISLLIIFTSGSFGLGWIVSQNLNPPQFIKVPYPILVDYWHEPQIVTVNVTEIREIEVVKEVEKIVYHHRSPQEWESIEQFTEWYYSQGFTLLFPSGAYVVDCDDYAEWVNREALKQSYHISDALTWYSMYYNKKVTDKYTSQEPGHAGNLVLIQGIYYYFEPNIKDFKGLIKVTDKD